MRPEFPFSNRAQAQAMKTNDVERISFALLPCSTPTIPCLEFSWGGELSRKDVVEDEIVTIWCLMGGPRSRP